MEKKSYISIPHYIKICFQWIKYINDKKNYKTAKIKYFYSHGGRESLLNMLEVKPEADKRGGKSTDWTN